MSFDESKRTFAGCPLLAMVATMEGLGVDALGVNCSLGPKQLGSIVDELVEKCSIPIKTKCRLAFYTKWCYRIRC